MSDSTRKSSSERRKGPKGPIGLVFGLATSLMVSLFAAVIFGTMLEVVGLYSFWKPVPNVPSHAYQHLIDDFAYVQGSTRAVLVQAPEQFARQLVTWARWPYMVCGVSKIIARAKAPKPTASPMFRSISTWAASCLEILVYVTQDVAVRLALAIFALPGLVLLLSIGVIDGLVQRDIRKWSGGRESSFLYHHAKHYAKWLMSVGFAVYLGWPFSAFNPTYLLLAFGLLTALALAMTCASFKKYL